MATRRNILPPRYTDVERIGAGGMGEIFLATDEELGRRVVVKVLASRYAQDDGLRRRFKREALAAARLSGIPNIVTIFDVGEYDSRPFIVMEYLAGGSLDDRARGRRLPPPAQVVEWLGTVAAALDAAHAAGVVHRDVKPGNLLLDERGDVHVADFGIASAAGLDSFTKTGTVLGTAGYLAPEQANGDRATAASDRYALGVVAFELLTGRRPFESNTPTAEAAAHIHERVPSAADANPALPRQVDRVFTRALAKDPAARYSTAGELVADLRYALHESAGETAVTAARSTAQTQSTPARRSRLWIPLVIGALILGGTALAVVATRGGGEGAATSQAQPTTVVRTVTQPRSTVERTVTAEPPTPTTAAPPPADQSSVGGAALNDAGFRRMQGGDYSGALPILEQAVAKLQGSGSLTEAYADFNLAYTRYALGRCDGVRDLLDQSESIQGERKEIDQLRKRVEKGCGQ
jgi:tRNA A-37 threonylcarbamoyl transferase component Bud32